MDDGSKDGTVRAAADFVRKHGFDAVRVLRLPRNRGKGYAGAPACRIQCGWFRVACRAMRPCSALRCTQGDCAARMPAAVVCLPTPVAV